VTHQHVRPILVTGSAGLIGKALCKALRDKGNTVIGIDIRSGEAWDISAVDAETTLWPDLLSSTYGTVRGVIDLAAVSRVVAGQRDPAKCWRTNVLAKERMARVLERQSAPPWLIFASSREVYGQPATLPALDSAPLAPLNVYAASKAAGELIAGQYGQRSGAPVAIVRFSSVYGSVDDHADRVVPAFARASAIGQDINVHGSDITLDLTHVSDVSNALLSLIEKLDEGKPPEHPILLSSGEGTRLVDLAQLAIRLADLPIKMHITQPRHYDVSRFYAKADYAAYFLGWKTRCSVVDGFSALIDDFRNRQYCPSSASVPAATGRI